MLMSLSETTFALQHCRVTEIIDHHLVLKTVSFRLPPSSLALFASLFKYLTACLPQRPKCLKTRGMTNGQGPSGCRSELYFAYFFSRFIAATSLLWRLPSLSPNTMDEPTTHLIQCLHLNLSVCLSVCLSVWLSVYQFEN